MPRKSFSKKERERVYNKTNGHCAYCGESIDYKDMQIDHINPVHLGGGNEDTNLLPACRSCNHYKHTLGLEEFRAYIQSITVRLARDNVTFKNAVRLGRVVINLGPVTFYFENLENNTSK